MNNQQVQDAFQAMSDPAVRRKYRDDPRAAYRELCAELGQAGAAFPELPAEVEVKAVFNTADTCYVALPEIGGDFLLGEGELERLQAAGAAAPAGPYAISAPQICNPWVWVSVDDSRP